MSLFLPQPRRIKLERGPESSTLELTYPAKVAASILFGPEDAFGVQDGTFRSTIQAGTSPNVLFRANEGTAHLSGAYIDRLSFTKYLEVFGLSADGNRICFEFMGYSDEDVAGKLLSANHFLPAILTLRFGIYVWVKEYTAAVGSRKLRLEVTRGAVAYRGASAELQENLLTSAFEELVTTNPGHHRWISSAYYYRNALRLFELPIDPQSLVAEILLNLTKALEILFSPSRDRLRELARCWGFDDKFVEERLIPLFLLRNELDVAHVATGPLSPAQKGIIIDFLVSAQGAVNYTISRVGDLVRDGAIELAPASKELDREKERLLEKISEYLRPGNDAKQV